jgi:hypothetical protein
MDVDFPGEAGLLLGSTDSELPVALLTGTFSTTLDG